MNKAIPVACSLSDKKFRERRQDYLDEAAASLAGAAELPDGFRYRFPLEDSTLRNLAEIVDLERKCCPFLNFRLVLEAGNDFVELELTGAEGTKEMLKSLFDRN